MNLFKTKLGIDLGTTHTLVYSPDDGIILNEPSLVAVDPRTEKIIAIGARAYEMLGRTPDDILVYKPMKNGVIADYRVTEAMLSYFIDKAVPSWNFFKPDVIVSVPAGITTMERSAVVEATLKAGARNAYVVKEPILAAIGAGIATNQAGGRMVVDIGGGTTDAAVISLGGIVASQSVKCAGTRIDAAIASYAKEKHGLLIGERTAEEAKIKAGSAIALSDNLEYEAKGQDSVSGLPRSITLTSSDIAKACRNELLEMIDAIKRVLQETPPELASDIIDHGITLTGGTSLLRNLPELIKEETGVTAIVANESLLCVAKGTGVVLEHLDLYKRRLLAK